MAAARVAMVLLLVGFCGLVLSAAGQKCETMDEGLFIAGGAAQVASLDPNIDITHSPVLRWLAGIPAVMVGARVPETAPLVPEGAMDLTSYKVQDVFDFAQRVMYQDGQDHDRILRHGRLLFCLLGALCAFLIWHEARRLGPWPALAAVVVFLFTPEVLAHSGWAHSDVAAATATFAVALALAHAIEEGTTRADVGLGLALGLAAITKLTGIMLWPVALGALLVFGGRIVRGLSGAATAAVVGWVVLVVAYFPDPRPLPHEFLPADLANAGIAWAEPALRWLLVPDTWLKGVVHAMLLSQRGQPAFLAGDVSTQGWWYYFPVAIFLKYPTGLLIVAAAGFWALWRSAQLSSGRKVALTLPPLVILGVAMTQSINIGVRSVLPIAPFLALWCAEAIAVSRKVAWRVATAALLATSVASGAAAYPDFLAYFNPMLGGTKAAGDWLVDSNLDWGQDLPALSRELRDRGVDEVRLAYFGAALPAHYGIKAADARETAEGWYAVSRTFLSGVWPPGDPYAWLRGLEPETYVGGSIALFSVKEQDVAEAWRRGEVAAGMALGLIRLRRDAAAAVDVFSGVLARSPNHYGALYQRAVSLEKAGRPDEALAAWQAFLRAAEAAKDEANVARARARIAELEGADSGAGR